MHALSLVLCLLAAGADAPARKPPPKPPPAARPAPPPPPPAPSEEDDEEDAPLFSQRGPRRLYISAALGPSFFVSPSNSGLPVMVRAVARASLDLISLGPAQLQVVVPVGFETARIASAFAPTTLYGFDLLPSLRATFPLLPKLHGYAELGLGFAILHSTAEIRYLGFSSTTGSGMGLQLSAGAEYELADRFTLFATPLAVLAETLTTSTTFNGNTVTATSRSSQWALLIGASYRLW